MFNPLGLLHAFLLSSLLRTRIVGGVEAPTFEDRVDRVVNALGRIAAGKTLDLIVTVFDLAREDHCFVAHHATVFIVRHRHPPLVVLDICMDDPVNSTSDLHLSSPVLGYVALRIAQFRCRYSDYNSWIDRLIQQDEITTCLVGVSCGKNVCR